MEQKNNEDLMGFDKIMINLDEDFNDFDNSSCVHE